MVEANTPIKAVQQRLGHSRPNTVLIYYARVLDKSADSAASLVSGQLSGAPVIAGAEASIISSQFACSWQRRYLSSHYKCLRELEARVGIEPTHKGFADISDGSVALVDYCKLLLNR
jgi:hypothetical protein